MNDEQPERPRRGTRGNDERIERLGAGDINKLMFEFALPAIAGVVVNALYNVIDSIFLGHGVGAAGLTATTVALPMMSMLIALGVLIGNGGNALAAIRLGEGKPEEAERILGNSFTLLLAAGVVVFFASRLLMEPILSLSGATAESLPHARAFMSIICGGFVFQGIGLGLNNFIRTAGAPRRALLTMVIGALVCAGLNYLFVLRLGWGVKGSAWATVIGQAVSSATVLAFFLSSKAPFQLRLACLRPRLEVCARILAFGAASFAIQVAAVVVSLVLNALLAEYGAQHVMGADGALAAVGVVIKLAMFTVFPCMGVAMAAQPLFGFNYGARNYDRVRTTFNVAVLWATALMVVFWAVVHLFPATLIGLFGVEKELMGFAVRALGVYLFALPIAGFQIIGSNYFQATGQPVKSILLTLSRQMLFLIPLLVVLPRVLPRLSARITGLDAICFAPPIADVLATFTTAVFIIPELRKLRNPETRPQEEAECESLAA